MRYCLIILVAFLSQSLTSVIAQEVSVSIVAPDLLDGNRSGDSFLEFQFAIPIAGKESRHSEFLVAFHWGTWLDDFEGFRCADVCPEAGYRAQLYGARLIYNSSVGWIRPAIFAGLANLYGQNQGDRPANKTLFEAGAYFSVIAFNWLHPFVAVSRYIPASGSSELAIVREAFQMGLIIPI